MHERWRWLGLHLLRQLRLRTVTVTHGCLRSSCEARVGRLLGDLVNIRESALTYCLRTTCRWRLHLWGHRLRPRCCVSTAGKSWLLRLKLRLRLLLLLLLHLRSLREAKTWLSLSGRNTAGRSARGRWRRSICSLRPSREARPWLPRWWLLLLQGAVGAMGSSRGYRRWNVSWPGWSVRWRQSSYLRLRRRWCRSSSWSGDSCWGLILGAAGTHERQRITSGVNF